MLHRLALVVCFVATKEGCYVCCEVGSAKLLEECGLGILEGVVVCFEDLHAFPCCGADAFSSGGVDVGGVRVHYVVSGERRAELNVVFPCGSDVPVRVPVEGVDVDVVADGAEDVQSQGSGGVPVTLSLGIREVKVFAGGSWG